MAQITLENVTKTFGAVTAVDRASLTIAEGELVALLGPSGCGKTTTLRLIAGLEVPDSGRIFIGDREVTRLPPRERDVAMVFQDYALYPHMTLMDNIGYPLKVRGVAKDELHQRVQAVARRLQIGDLLDRRPGQISGGQQQRAAVARAVVHEAQAFLFDEPLSNLDAKLRLEARAFLKHLQHTEGVTAAYVTHDQAEAMALADRIVVMNHGKIMQIGSPLDVYRNPQNTFVASFIGNPPMNLLACHLDAERGMLIVDSNQAPLDLSLMQGPIEAPLKDGDSLTLGVRPENITLGAEPGPAAIPGKIYVTQPLGGETLVNVEVGDQLVSVRIFTEELPPLPEQVWLTLDLARTFLYGPDGERIL